LLVAAAKKIGEPEAHLFKLSLSSHKAVELGSLSGFPLGLPCASFVWNEPGRSILFSRTANALTNLWVYDLTSRIYTQITTGPGPDLQPMSYTSGKQILFVNGRGSGFLTAFHPRNNSSRDIVSANASQPVLSPGSGRLIYLKIVDQNRNELWVSDLMATIPSSSRPRAC
jgi:hypothetical protein